ncbi:MAG: hypothetical protein ACQEXJ_09405 [Myxococcota bacterium]
MMRTHRITTLLAALALTGLAACDDGGATFVTEDDVTTDTAGTPDTSTGPDTVNGCIPKSEPAPALATRNAACRAPEFEDTCGPTVPWQGFTHQGTTYTCNRCPYGQEVVEASWRNIRGDTEDPDDPLDPADYRERFTFSGNTWRQRSEGTDSATGQSVSAVIEGWYFCGVKPENPKETRVLVVTDVEPEGAFGFTEGLVYSADFLIDPTVPTKMAFGYYDGLNAPEDSYRIDVYCRVGTTIQTLDGEQKPCTDPFDG